MSAPAAPPTIVRNMDDHGSDATKLHDILIAMFQSQGQGMETNNPARRANAPAFCKPMLNKGFGVYEVATVDANGSFAREEFVLFCPQYVDVFTRRMAAIRNYDRQEKHRVRSFNMARAVPIAQARIKKWSLLPERDMRQVDPDDLPTNVYKPDALHATLLIENLVVARMARDYVPELEPENDEITNP
ncbi:hypothetical protein CC79DRAFT_1360269 [Sarocladium strictum]